MLTEIYIEALLVDEELADQVWEAWDQGEIDDQALWLAWWVIALRPSHSIPGISLLTCCGSLATRWERLTWLFVPITH